MLKHNLSRVDTCSSRSCARLQRTAGSVLYGRQQHSRQAVAAATAADDDSRDYSQEEADAYAEVLRQRKAAKQEALQDLKRKRKFNPLHAKLKVSPADAPAGPAAPATLLDRAAAADGAEPAAADGPAAASKPSPAAAAAAAVPSGSSGAAGARFAARLRAVPAGLRQQQQQQVGEPVPSRPAAAALAAQQQQQQPQEDFPPLQQVFDAAGDTEPGDAGSAGAQHPADSELAAMLAELMAGGEEDVPVVQPLPARAARRNSAAQVKAAAIAKRAVAQQFQRKQQRAMLQAAAAGDGEDDDEDEEEADEQMVPARKPAAAGKAAAAGAGAGVPARQAPPGAAQHAAAVQGTAEDEDAEDDLDWEALGQYEQLEKYLGQLHKENSGAAPRRAKLEPAAAAAAAAAKPPAAVQQPVTTPAAAAAQPAARQAPKSVAAAASSAGTKRVKSSSSSSGGGSSSRMDKDLDELEQLVSMLQAMESSSSSSSSSSGRQQQPQRPAGAGSGSAAAAAGGDPGDALLKALLGSDWEAELLDDLAAVIDEEDGQTPAQQQQQTLQQRRQLAQGPGQPGSTPAAAGSVQSAEDAAADAAEDEQPWADDVTGLLLGLVSISHEKYISSPLPLPGGAEAVGEEQRCDAFWRAPWALFVVDDSAQSCIEYVNEAAGGLFGGGYLDLFGRAAHELVATDLTAQSDWAYAVQKVEESASFSVALPQLELQDLAGQRVVARNVILWRVDSLEDTPIGMAVLIKSWERA